MKAMFKWYRRWRDARVIRNNPIDERDWQAVLEQLPLLARLSPEDLARLRRLAVLFIHQKDFVGLRGQVLTGNMALLIALQACLPILNLGLEWYQGWQTVMVYPAAFRARRTQADASGIHHEVEHLLAGEAWQQAGVILSWDDTAHAGVIDGHNLVIHEFVHKLDMLNGQADGFPPLRKDMSVAYWTESFTQAFQDFQQRIAEGSPVTIDRYGATNPAEFVAVTSEVFFETPEVLAKAYPDVYQNYRQLFDQDPQADFSHLAVKH